MRVPNLDKVEIVEPPIGELTKKHSSLKRACLSGCGSVLLFLIALVIAIRIFVGPGPKTVKTVPEHFPQDIPLYDRDHIEQITFIRGKYKERGTEVASLVSKYILSPLLKDFAQSGIQSETQLNQPSNAIQGFWMLVKNPTPDNRDTVRVEWRGLKAEPSFVFSFYRTELIKAGYDVEFEEGDEVKSFAFSKGKTDGMVTVGPRTASGGTEYAILVINVAADRLKIKF